MADQDAAGTRGPLGRLVWWLCGRPRRVIALVLLAAALAAAHAVSSFRINMDTAEMLSERLSFRQVLNDYREAFPLFDRAIVAVVEAPTATAARQAAERLAAAVAVDDLRFSRVFTAAAEPYFQRNALLFKDDEAVYDMVDVLTDSAASLAALAQDPSSRQLFRLLALSQEETGGSLQLKPREDRGGYDRLLTAVAEELEDEAAGRPGRLDWSGLMTPEGLRPAARQIVLIEPRLDFAGLQPGGQALRALRGHWETVSEAMVEPVTLSLTGRVALRADELNAVKESIGLAGALSLLLVSLVLWRGLGSVRLALAGIGVLLVGLLFTAGFAISVVGAFNILSVAFIVLFIGLSIDFSIHFLLRAREERRRADTREALARVADGLGRPLFLCAATGIIAFLSFLPTSYDGLSELGVISAGGLGIAFLLTFLLLPPVVRLTGLPAARGPETSKSDPLARRPVPVVGLAIAVGLAALVAAPQIRFDFDPMALRDPGSESVQTLRRLEAEGKGTEDRLIVIAPTAEAGAALAEGLREAPAVGEVRTLSDLIPEASEDVRWAIADARDVMAPVLDPPVVEPPPDDGEVAMTMRRLAVALSERDGRGDPAARERLRVALLALAGGADGSPRPGLGPSLDRRLTGDLPSLFADLALLVNPDERPTVEDLPDALRRQFQAEDGRVLVQIGPAEPLRSPTEAAAFVDAVRGFAGADITGRPAVTQAAGAAVTEAFAIALLLTLAVVSLLLLAVLRRPLDVAMVLLPLALAATVTVAITVLLGMPFNFANVIVLPLLFGLGVDSGIHMVSRWREGVPAERLTRSSTARAVLVSGLTTVGSFASLSISSHQGMASMGVLLTVAITMTLLATLVLLPAALALRARP